MTRTGGSNQPPYQSIQHRPMTYTPQQLVDLLEHYYQSQTIYERPWLEETVVELLHHVRTTYVTQADVEDFKRHRGLQALAADMTHKVNNNQVLKKRTPRITSKGAPAKLWDLEKRMAKYGPGPALEALTDATQHTLTAA